LSRLAIRVEFLDGLMACRVNAQRVGAITLAVNDRIVRVVPALL